MSAYKFSLDFQRHILASVVGDADFARSNLDSIKPEYFSDELLIGIAEAAILLVGKFGEAPSKEALLNDLKPKIAPGRQFTEYADEVEIIYSKVGDNHGYYQSKAVDFARVQAISNAVRDAVPLIETGELDEVGRMVNDALLVGQNLVRSDVYDYFEEAKDRIRSYLDREKEKEGRISTGFGPLDEMMMGGLGKGELGVVVALPKSGKTTMQVCIGAHALVEGKRVCYVTLELSKRMIAMKFDTNLFRESMESIRQKPAQLARAIVGLRDSLMGRLFIVEKPTRSVTVEQIASIVRKIGKIDLLIVDYGQLIKPPAGKKERRHELSEIYEGLRRVAGELQIPVWTAHQSNRPGTDAKVIRSENIAEDFNIIAIADIGVSVNHTEEEKRGKKCRLFVMGSRIGPSGDQILCDVNFATSNMNATTDEGLE